MILKGRVYKFGNDINTDYIISGRYKFQISDIKELSKHVMEDVDPDFYAKLKPGASLLVAGKNFGLGSSREQAPLVVKTAGIVAVVAKSFARIFYRNAVNIGLPLVEVDTDAIADSDELEIDLEKGILRNLTQESEIKISPLPDVMRKLLSEGGLVEHFKKHGGIAL